MYEGNPGRAGEYQSVLLSPSIHLKFYFIFRFLLKNDLFKGIIHCKPNEVKQIHGAVIIGSFVETGGLSDVGSHVNPYVPSVVTQNRCPCASEVCLTMYKF